MRILIASQYFPPEVGAPPTRAHGFAAGLAARGHEVHVVCEVPNYPQGVVHKAYRGRLVRRQRLDGIHGAWVWVYTRAEKTTRDRLAFYASYAAAATLWASALPRPDVVFATSPPLPVGAVGSLLAKRHRVPWVLDVRDLWPEAAVAVGELGGGRAFALAERLEGFLYRDATAVTTVTRPFVAHIAEKAGSEEKVELVPNGTTEFWVDAGAVEADRSAVGLPDDRFVWTFAGNVGLAQGLQSAVDAAGLLGADFKLVVLGDGAAKPGLIEQAHAVAAGNVEFRDQVPKEEAAAVLRASDALLVSLSADPVLASFIPTKLFDFCALGRPVLVAANGEPHRLVEEADAGIPVPAGDADALAAAIRALRVDPERGRELSKAGRRFASANLRSQQIERLEEVLTEAAARRR